jgi:hypothetical protein
MSTQYTAGQYLIDRLEGADRRRCGPAVAAVVVADEKASLMASVPETRIHAWDHSRSADTQLQRVMTFLVGTLGIVLVTLLTWFVLLVVRY